MNIRYLEIMEAVAETGTFTGAAKNSLSLSPRCPMQWQNLKLRRGQLSLTAFPKELLSHAAVELYLKNPGAYLQPVVISTEESAI